MNKLHFWNESVKLNQCFQAARIEGEPVSGLCDLNLPAAEPRKVKLSALLPD